MFVLGSTQPGIDTEWFVTGGDLHNKEIQKVHHERHEKAKLDAEEI